MMPGDFAPWKTFIIIFPFGRKERFFEVTHETLVEKVSVMEGKKEEPTVPIYRQMSGLVGKETALQIQSIIKNASANGSSLTAITGFVTLIISWYKLHHLQHNNLKPHGRVIAYYKGVNLTITLRISIFLCTHQNE